MEKNIGVASGVKARAYLIPENITPAANAAR